jgi:hypothetical protein
MDDGDDDPKINIWFDPNSGGPAAASSDTAAATKGQVGAQTTTANTDAKQGDADVTSGNDEQALHILKNFGFLDLFDCIILIAELLFIIICVSID